MEGRKVHFGSLKNLLNWGKRACKQIFYIRVQACTNTSIPTHTLGLTLAEAVNPPAATLVFRPGSRTRVPGPCANGKFMALLPSLPHTVPSHTLAKGRRRRLGGQGREGRADPAPDAERFRTGGSRPRSAAAQGQLRTSTLEGGTRCEPGWGNPSSATAPCSCHGHEPRLKRRGWGESASGRLGGTCSDADALFPAAERRVPNPSPLLPHSDVPELCRGVSELQKAFWAG